MATRQSPRQKRTVGRVMHEYKRGTLKTHGRRVGNPKQAIAIGLSEAGASRKQRAGGRSKTATAQRSRTVSRRTAAKRTATAKRSAPRAATRRSMTKRSAAQSRTRQSRTRQTRATQSRATQSRATQSRATRGSASRRSASARSTARRGATRRRGERTFRQLYAEAKRRGLEGRSYMSKAELERALHH